MAERISAGFRYLFYGVVDTNGYLVGNTASGAAAGATAGEGMLRLQGAQTAPVAVGESERVTSLGDDEPLTTFDFEAADLPAGVIEMAVMNTVFDALCQGTKVETIGDLTVGVLQPGAPSRPDLCLLFQRRAKKWEAGVRGIKAWQILFAPRCTVTPLYAEFQQRATTPYRYSVVTSKTDRKPWGATLSEAVNGTETAPLIPIESDNPVHLHAFKGNNIQTAFVLAYTPKTSAKLYVYIDGNKKVLTTDYTLSSKTVTFVAAPGSNAQVQVLYEVDEGDLS